MDLQEVVLWVEIAVGVAAILGSVKSGYNGLLREIVQNVKQIDDLQETVNETQEDVHDTREDVSDLKDAVIATTYAQNDDRARASPDQMRKVLRDQETGAARFLEDSGDDDDDPSSPPVDD